MAFAKIEIYDTGNTVDFDLDIDGVDLSGEGVDFDELSPAQIAALHMWNMYHEAMDNEDEYDAG